MQNAPIEAQIYAYAPGIVLLHNASSIIVSLEKKPEVKGKPASEKKPIHKPV